MSKNAPEFYYGIGKDIVDGGIFERFPELIPYIGDNYYSIHHKELIFIGESNYFEKECEAVSVFQDTEEWYNGNDTDKLIPENKKDCVKCAKGYRTLNNAFKVANDVLKSKVIKLDNEKWFLHETAFYNYFLRPALNIGKGKAKKFKPKPLDREVAGAALCDIIERLHPQIIVFISKFAFDAFDKYLKDKNLNYDDIKILWAYHPASRRHWWHGAYGRPYLENILKENWLNK